MSRTKNPEQTTLASQTMLAELVQRCFDADFDETYDERGQFRRRRINDCDYWYYQRDLNGKKTLTYVGPARDPEITSRIERFATLKSDFGQRREMVRALLAIGLPAPDPMSALVVEALWKAGFFRLRGVLVGTVAFQAYAGLLGVKLSNASLMTQDADFAQFYDVSHLVGDSIPPILDILHIVDPSFSAIPGIFDPARVTRFRTSQGYLVEFLTPNRGSDHHMGKPADMPALGGASAIPLRFLDFLIHEPVRTVLLYKGGIPVTVPAPERYGVHKLIVAAERKANVLKSSKDIAQAEQIIAAMLPRRRFVLAEAWQEAWARGPTWRAALTKGLSMVRDDVRVAFKTALAAEGAELKPKRTVRKQKIGSAVQRQKTPATKPKKRAKPAT